MPSRLAALSMQAWLGNWRVGPVPAVPVTPAAPPPVPVLPAALPATPVMPAPPAGPLPATPVVPPPPAGEPATPVVPPLPLPPVVLPPLPDVPTEPLAPEPELPPAPVGLSLDCEQDGLPRTAGRPRQAKAKTTRFIGVLLSGYRNKGSDSKPMQARGTRTASWFGDGDSAPDFTTVWCCNAGLLGQDSGPAPYFELGVAPTGACAPTVDGTPGMPASPNSSGP